MLMSDWWSYVCSSDVVGAIALDAVQDVVLAVGLGPGLQGRSVRTGVGLGQSERHDQFAAGDSRQVVAFLFVGAVHQNALRTYADVGAEHRTKGQGRLPQFECHPAFLAHGQAYPAVLFGDGQAEQIGRAHVRTPVTNATLVSRLLL